MCVCLPGQIIEVSLMNEIFHEFKAFLSILPFFLLTALVFDMMVTLRP